MEDESLNRRYTVGYALAEKKRGSFIQPSLLSLAASRGVDLVPIDPERPLAEQGPFDCVIHKLPGDSWLARLRDFSSLHPSVPVVDDPAAIACLHNRISMLQVVSDLRLPRRASATFGTPRQIAVHDPAALAPASAELNFPLVAKPVVADGTARSHKMALVFGREALARLRPPVVLQEFVNHGGVVFKVYVVGDHVRCVRRRSLPDVTEEDRLHCAEGSVSFSQVSNVTGIGGKDEYYRTFQLEDAELPPADFIEEIAGALRRELGMNLFNFDVIRDVKLGNHYLVIDINYFPGYAKMPSYETVLTDFFCEIVRRRDVLPADCEDQCQSIPNQQLFASASKSTIMLDLPTHDVQHCVW